MNLPNIPPTLSSPTSNYLNYLPANLRQDVLLEQFLLAFEQILTGGVLEKGQPGLEEHIDQISAYFRPLPPQNPNGSGLQQTPEAFLPWLASWIALSLRDDWNEVTKRRFIRRMVPLYRKRGTKEGLKEVLELYVRAVSGRDERDEGSNESEDNSVEIYEFEHPAHYFQVTIRLPDRSNLERTRAITRAILDQEKPAHTFYSFQLLFSTMQINNDPNSEQRLLLGRNTLLGTQEL